MVPPVAEAVRVAEGTPGHKGTVVLIAANKSAGSFTTTLSNLIQPLASVMVTTWVPGVKLETEALLPPEGAQE